jgi:iron complex outermembrane recepter protein
MHGMRYLPSLLVLAAFSLAAAPAAAEDERAAQAKMHYESGMARFQLEEWDGAIAEFQEGFRIRPYPQFLYNIAQAYRQSKRPEKALAFYQKFLRMDPKTPNRAEVERLIADLQKAIDEQKRAESSPPVQPTPVPAPPSAAEPAAGSAPIAATAQPSAATTAQADLTARPAEKPVYKKPWFWGVVGGAAAVVAGGVVLGVVLGTHHTDNTLPLARF